MAVSVKVTKVWPVEKYARFVSDGGHPAAFREGKKGGAWQHYTSKDGIIQMALMESNHLMVSSGNQIYESFSLWETRKWIKAVTKGDSLLFLYRLKDENRKFRVKFSAMGPSTSSLVTCKSCIATLSDLVPIREMAVLLSGSSSTASDTTTGGLSDSQIPCYEDTQPMSQLTQEASLLGEPTAVLPTQAGTGCKVGIQEGTVVHTRQYQEGSSSEALHSTATTGKSVEEGRCVVSESELMSIPDVARTLLSQPKSLGRAYAETNYPTGQLGAFIRLCLTDSNFPGFVEAVEKELDCITSDN